MPLAMPLPAYYKHPRTGLLVEVDTTGVTVLGPGYVAGEHRSFREMRDTMSSAVWSAADEIGVLVRGGWVRMDAKS